jgi:hypothetical protein
MHEKKYIIELLPYSRNCLLFDISLRKRVVSLLGYLFEEILVAIDAFHAKKFLNFDPHVGENLCQIRAVQLMDLSEQLQFSDIHESRNRIVIALRRLSCVNEKDIAEIFYNKESQCILTVFLEELKINIEISPSTYYLFLCHFLTRFRTFNPSENTIINYKKITDEIKISKNLSRKIIHEYQKKLSLESSQYIEKLAGSVKIKTTNNIYLKKTREIDDDGRTVYPCFLVTDIILYKLMEMKSDIFCLIRTNSTSKNKLICMRFIFNEEKRQYEFSEKTSLLQNELPAFIVHGITCRKLNTESELNNFINLFKKEGIYQIIMAGMADHPQYSGKKLAPIEKTIFFDMNFDNSIIRKFLNMKYFSQQFGCSSADARTLFIRHIFCDYISNQLQYANQGFFYSNPIITV